jgi:hypothetical protein
MKWKQSRIGLSILAGGLSFVGTANATNILLNSSFETYSGGGDVNGQRGTNDWVGYFSQYNHTSEAYYDGAPIPASENPGTYYSWRPASDFPTWDNFTTPEDQSFFLANEIYAYALTQTAALTNVLSGAAIDAGSGQYTFSAWLASYNTNPEQPFLLLRFFDDTATQDTSTGVQIGNDATTSVIFDRTTNTFAVTYADGTTTIPADLSGDHKWIKYVATGTVPATARKARVYVTRSPNAGKTGSPDTYIDLVKLDVIDTSQATTNPPSISTPPASQTAALGNSVSFSAVAIGDGVLTYQWRHEGTNLPNSTTSSLSIPLVRLTDAGIYDIVVTNPGGSRTSAPPAVLTVINPLVLVGGQWDFSGGNLAATVGADLQYYDATVQADTSFGTTTSFGIPNINGQPAKVMRLNPSTSPWGGYKMFHGQAPNGGGTNVNQYTLIYDLYFASSTWRSLLQTEVANTTDGELFINPTGGLGISGFYDGNVTAGAWHRIALAVDLSGPGQAPVLTKFIDGVKVGNQTGGLSVPDDRFSLGPLALLFGDNDGDIADTYVSSVQFSNGRRPDAFLVALGGPTAYKIPGAIKATIQGSTVYISWTGFPGATGLESATSLTGPWSPVVTALNPYPAPGGAQPTFYRPAIHP